MKEILRTTVLVAAVLFAYGGTAVAQTIDLKIADGVVTLNDRILSENELPASLKLDGVRFRARLRDARSIVVEINGRQYDITRRTIEPKAWRTRKWHVRVGEGDYELRGNGSLWTLPKPVDMAEAMRLAAEAFAATTGSLDKAFESYSRNVNRNVDRLTVSLTRLADRTDTLDITIMPRLSRMAEVSSYLSQVHAADQELFAEVQAEWLLEAEMVALAARIRAMEASDERRAQVEKLRAQLQEAFKKKQDNRRREIRQLEEELARLKERTEERDQARERLIEARLRELLGSEHMP